MGCRWGINRTGGQIHALIYVSQQAMYADNIAQQPEFSRSNVSMGLKELQAWRLVRLRHVPGDRRDQFDAPSDAWAVFQTRAEERRRRAMEPTLSMLRNALLEHAASDTDRYAQERMKDMRDLIELIMKTEGDLQPQAMRWAKMAWAPVVLAMVLISVATPLVSATVRGKWFVLPEFIAPLRIPLMTLAALVGARAILNSHRVLGKVCWLPFVLPAFRAGCLLC